MELYQVRAFVTVARLGHVTKAADALCLTQPAVTAQIKSLESSLGVALFDRSGGRLTLTRPGEKLLPHAEALLAVGHQVHAVCPDKKAGEHIKTAIHDFEGAQTYSEKPGHNFALNASFADVKPQDYDALVLPGGRGPEYLRTYPAVVAAVQHFFEADKPVAAICHAAQLLAGAGVLKGRSCSAYPACRAEVELAGGRYADIAVDKAHTDGNLVSAPAWPAHPDWIAQFLAVLGTRITH